MYITYMKDGIKKFTTCEPRTLEYMKKIIRETGGASIKVTKTKPKGFDIK